MSSPFECFSLMSGLVAGIKQQLRSSHGAECPELAHFQAKVLSLLARFPGMTQSELAALVMRDKAQIARVIKELEERGWLKREPNPDDRRAMGLLLTDTGLIRAQQFIAHRNALIEKMFEGLSVQECQQLHALIERLHPLPAGKTQSE